MFKYKIILLEKVSVWGKVLFASSYQTAQIMAEYYSPAKIEPLYSKE